MIITDEKIRLRKLGCLLPVLLLLAGVWLFSSHGGPKTGDPPAAVREYLPGGGNGWRIVQVGSGEDYLTLPIDPEARIGQYVLDGNTLAATYSLADAWYLLVQGTGGNYLLALEDWFADVQIAAPLLAQGKVYLAVGTTDAKQVYEIVDCVPVWLADIHADLFSFQKGSWTVCGGSLYYIAPSPRETGCCGDLILAGTDAVINRRVEFVGTWQGELVWRQRAFPLRYRLMIGDGRKGRLIRSDFWVEADGRANAFDISADGIVMLPTVCFSDYAPMELYFIKISTGEWDYCPVYSSKCFEILEAGEEDLLAALADTPVQGH